MIPAPWSEPPRVRNVMTVKPLARAERVRSGGSLVYAYDFGKWEPYEGKQLAEHVASLEKAHAAGTPIQTHELCWMPREMALAWWNRHDVVFHWGDWALRTVVAVYDIAALDGALARIAGGVVDANHSHNFGPHSASIDGLEQVDSPRVAPVMARWWAREKRKEDRASAGRWLEKFAETAAVGLVPHAVGADGDEQADAHAALQWLEQRGHGDAVRAGAAGYGAAVAAEVEALVTTWTPPKKAPKLPAYLGALPKVKGLSADDVANLVRLLAAWPAELVEEAEAVEITIDGEPVEADDSVEDPLEFAMSWPVHALRLHAGVRAAVRDHDTAALGTALFEAWRDAGAPAKDKWVLFAASALGGPATAKAIAAWIPAAPAAQGLHGLDALRHLGARDAIERIATGKLGKKVREKAAYFVRRLDGTKP